MLIVMLMVQALAIPDDTSGHRAMQAAICSGDSPRVQALALDLAKAGDPEGFSGLGWLEETATPSAPTRAYAYYLTAAQHGSLRAQWKVGVMLDTGLGVPVDSKAAARWLRKAARRKLGAAWASLACCVNSVVVCPKTRSVRGMPISTRSAMANRMALPGSDRSIPVDPIAGRTICARSLGIALRRAMEMGSRRKNWPPFQRFLLMRNAQSLHALRKSGAIIR
ncbi:tetratricopeptide repeat protein [Sphingobium sp. CFD-1]|uniref:tetratricopeptide repeat protein n=1 Tax=Sphingobium sp. CFD-1 TaxID=2878545 RepID=UPI00214C4781|nr:tetratricopeptide repeat protein [Sphingobium sp. CFD-1]